MSATTPAVGTSEHAQWRGAARARAREELKRANAEADRLARQFATVAAAGFVNRVTDAEVEEAQQAHEVAQRARTRAAAAAQGLGAGELLPRFGPL